jgi:hypothetical protein
VAGAAAGALLVVVLLDLLAFGRLNLGFDVCFVLVCLGAALAVRPRDFFVIGVLPPLALLGVVLGLALLARGAVADAHDVVLQAVVSGLAHHAGALIVGYGATLGVLALRQVALRHAGTLRSGARRPTRPPQPAPLDAPPGPARIPEQRSPSTTVRRSS